MHPNEKLTRPIRIVGFLQNPWFPEGTKPQHINLYQSDQEFHRRLLQATPTGARLKMAFGDLFTQIFWDNVGPAHIGDSRTPTKVDMKHVEAVISDQDPDLILVFGERAKKAVAASIGAINRTVLECHHPNARHHFQFDLDAFAYEVSRWIMYAKPIDIDRKNSNRI